METRSLYQYTRHGQDFVTTSIELASSRTTTNEILVVGELQLRDGNTPIS